MRRWVAAVVLGLAAVVAGCGGGSGTVDASAPRPRPEAAPAQVGPQGEQTVSYHGLELRVPAGWPVHDLEAAPSTCVRFDLHAVYLGSPSPDMVCPAQVIGRADAVLIEPGSTPTASGTRSGVGGVTVQVNGLSVSVDDARRVEHELVVGVPDASVTVTMSFGESDAVAQQIITTMRAA